MMRAPRSPVVALAALTLLATACLPSRVVIDLAPSDGELQASTVLTHPEGSAPRDRVALVELEGLIAYAPPSGLFAGAASPVDRVIARLRRIETESSIKAVILRVNSPGGTVAASEELHAELIAFRERTGKPIVAWFGEIATSGAYYTALAADTIVAQPSSVTASIGVVVQTFNFSEGMRRVGIDGRTVTSGDNKSMGNPFEPAQESHYQVLQDMVDEFYESFRSMVAERYPQAAASSDFDRLTDGRVITGQMALEAGLVEQVGTLRDAFAAARELAGIESAALIQLHPEGAIPGSAYAVASTGAPTPEARGVSVTDLLAAAALDSPRLSPGFYYLWRPPAAP